MRKILDIWVKGSTFPPPTLERLKQKLSPSAPPSMPGSVKSPGYPYADNAQAGPSTTPPGSPLKAGGISQGVAHGVIGANDGYAHLGGMATERSGSQGTKAGAGKSSFSVDLLELLGVVVFPSVCVSLLRYLDCCAPSDTSTYIGSTFHFADKVTIADS